MDDHEFDTLTRRVTRGESRRHVLKTVGGGVIATALVGLGLRETTARTRCRRVTERCTSTRQCCGQTTYCAVTSTTFARGTTVCCKPAGARCTMDAACCGVGSFCFNGQFCQD